MNIPAEILSDVFAPSGLVVAKALNPLDIETDGMSWAKTLYPHLFNRPFTSYQKEFWDWGWQIEPHKYYRPRVECHPRGVGKSTNGEAFVVSAIARKKRQMVGYLSLEETKATKHFESIKTMLESDNLLKYYPHCKPKVQKLKSLAEHWSREAIITESDAMIVPLTLLGSSRGWKSSTGQRFDLLILDDIDKLGQSPELIKKLIELLKGEILAAGTDETAVLMLQNLIHRDSICTQIFDHRADILSNRIFCGPFPLLKWYDAVKEDIPDDPTGGKEWRITDGETYDPAISLEYATQLLNTFGKSTFNRECQQKVFEVEEDKDFREWNEVIHLITHSEFRRVMEEYGEDVWNYNRGCLQIPDRWNVGIGFDWGTTVGHPSAVAYVARPSEHSPMNDCHFVVGEVVRPTYPRDSFEEAELVSPGRVALAMKAFQRQWNISDAQIKMKLLSHEASAALNTMMLDLPEHDRLFFNKWKAKKGSGVPQIQNLLEVDKTKDHPFRCYPRGFVKNGIDVSGKPLEGRPRLYFIVADNQGSLKVDVNNELYVLGAKNAEGMARARFEMPLYSFRNQNANNKIDDDWIDGFRGLMNVFGVYSEDMSDMERIVRDTPEPLKNPTTVEQIMGRNMFFEQSLKAIEDKKRASDLFADLDNWRKR